MPIADWAGPVSALGGMLSAAIASATYVATTVQRRRLSARDRAGQIRENIRLIVSSLHYLSRELMDGLTLIAAASSVTENLRGRLSDKSDTSELRKMVGESGLMLSVAVTGWHRDPAAGSLSERVNKLRVIPDSFEGALIIYQEILELFVNLVRDGYSAVIFVNLFAILDDDTSGIKWEEPLHSVLNQINVSLQSNAAMYFIARYSKAVKEILALTDYLSRLLIGMEDNALIAAGNGPVSNHGATHTATMRAAIRSLSTHLKKEEENTLFVYADNLETYISKSHAGDELKHMKD
jgi:hypothetical protein